MKNLNFVNSPTWKFHRNGWPFVSQHLRNEFHDKYGIHFYEWADKEFSKRRPIKTKWGGILHNVISYPDCYKTRSDIQILSLEDLIKKDFFQESLKYCSVLFTLSKKTAAYLSSNGINAIALKHPTPFVFNWQHFEGNIVTVGQWLRKLDSISLLETDYKKFILKVPWSEPYKDLFLKNVTFLEYKEKEDYDNFLSRSVVFLDMFDVAACNTINECILSNTPLIINRREGAEEYLGKDYPLFYDKIEDIVINDENIYVANLYLKKMDKKELSIEFFLEQFNLATSFITKNRLFLA